MLRPPQPAPPSSDSESSTDYAARQHIPAWQLQSDTEQRRSSDAESNDYQHHNDQQRGSVISTTTSHSSQTGHSIPSSAGSYRPSLRCSIENSHTLIDLLTSLDLGEKQQLCTLTLLPAGIKFAVNKSQSLCIKSYLKHQCLPYYQLRSDAEHLQLDVDLKTFIQCLSIFGKDSVTHVDMEWNAIGDPLKLILEDQGTITECELPTFDVDQDRSEDFQFKSSPTVAAADLDATHLKMCFAEFDIGGVDSLQISMQSQAPRLVFATKGDAMSVRIEFPDPHDARSKDVFMSFECDDQQHQYDYSMNLVRPCIRALAKATVGKLKMNATGMLSMQFSIPVQGQRDLVNWMELLVCSQVEANL